MSISKVLKENAHDYTTYIYIKYNLYKALGILYNSNTLDSYTDFGLYLSYDIASSSCSMPINNSF